MSQINSILKFINNGISLLLIFSALSLLAITTPWLGFKTLIVRSGSMEPYLRRGDLLLVRQHNSFLAPIPAVYSSGQVISFSSASDEKIITTHRIVDISSKNGEIYYITKGDANDANDKLPVSTSHILGTQMFSIPLLGRILALGKTKAGFLSFIIVPSLLVIFIELRTLVRELKGQLHLKPSAGSAQPSFSWHFQRVLLIMLPLALWWPLTAASFSDSEISSSNTFTAETSFGLVINELLPNTGTTFIDEWVEIFNGGSTTVDLTGWTLKDIALAPRSLTSLGTIEPGGFAVYVESGGGWLNDSNETLQLRDPTANVVDQHTYTSSSNDVSIGRQNDGELQFKTCTTTTQGTSNNGIC